MGSEPTATTPRAGNDRIDRASHDGPDLEFFRLSFSEFPDPVIVIDIRGRVLFLNDSAQSLTGRLIPQERSFSSSEILRMVNEDPCGSLVDQCLDKKSLRCARVHLKNQAGDWLPFSLSAQLAHDKEGKTTGCVVILRDAFSAENHLLGPIFASVINNFPMPFFTVDTNLKVTYINHHLEKLTGYKSHEVINRMTCAELFRTEQCHTAECILRQAMEQRTSFAGLRRAVLDRQGRKIPVAVHCSMITDSEQRVIGGFKAIRDITPLAEAEQKIRTLIEITQEGILMVDETGRVIYANSKMEEVLERSKDGLIGKDVSGILPPQHLDIMRDLVQKVDTEHPQDLRFCSTIERAGSSGELRGFETCIAVSRVGKSLITCMYFHDLSKHIEIERQLFNANSFLNNIIKSSADGIAVVGTDGTILIFNEAAERILGYSAEEVIGKPDALNKVYCPETAREIMRRIRSDQYGPPGKLTSTRLTLVTKDGEEVPVNFSAAIIKKNDREIGSVGIFSDLRERLRIRKELEDAKFQLMQAEKIASIGRLAAGVAHEINNPLSGILIYADLLSKDLAHNPQWSGDLQEIVDQTLRCKQIVKRLLDFSRQSAGQRITFDINMIINRSAELLARQALFHNVDLVLDLQPDIPQMTGDPGQLQQVFTNLIINAGTAMDGKGKILIRSGFDSSSEQITLQFEDTGPGIPPEIISQIFEPFFTTKGPGEGTGLGLSVAYGIIQQHGGSIAAGTAASGGAAFTIILPLESPEPAIEFTT